MKYRIVFDEADGKFYVEWHGRSGLLDWFFQISRWHRVTGSFHDCVYDREFSSWDKARDFIAEQERLTGPKTHVVEIPVSFGDDRAWCLVMAAAPRDRVIEVVARLPTATAGFPQYVQWDEEEQAFCSREYTGTPTPVVAWAWRLRTAWPQEPGR